MSVTGSAWIVAAGGGNGGATSGWAYAGFGVFALFWLIVAFRMFSRRRRR
jgi:hypothetical protein